MIFRKVHAPTITGQLSSHLLNRIRYHKGICRGHASEENRQESWQDGRQKGQQEKREDAQDLRARGSKESYQESRQDLKGEEGRNGQGKEGRQEGWKSHHENRGE